MHNHNKGFLGVSMIIGLSLVALLTVGLAIGVRLTQQETQLKSQASGIGSITVGKTTVNKIGGSWEQIPINVTVNVPGADGSKKIASIFVRLRPGDPNSGAGWGEIFSYGTNGSGVVETYSPPAHFQPGVYEFGLFLMNGEGPAVDVIAVSSPVTFQDTLVCPANQFDAANCRICSGDGSHWIESYGNNVNSTEWCSCAKRKAPDYADSGTYATCRAAESGSNNATANFTESTKTVYKQADGRWEPVTLSFNGSGAQSGARVYYSHNACGSRASCGRAGGWTEIPPKNLYGSGGSQYSGQVTISSDQSVAFGINPGIHTAVVWNETASPQVTADNVALAFVRLEYKNEVRGSGSGGDITEAAACGGITFKKGGSVIASLSSGGTVSGSLKAGEAYDVTVTMRNVDASNSSYQGPTWIAGPVTSGTDNGKFFLGYMTSGDTGPGDQFTVNTTHSGDWGINWANSAKLRIALTGNVSAGQPGTFNFSATPKNVGLQSFYWGMVHEGKTWFGGQCAAQFNVEAASSGGTGTAAPSASGSVAPSSEIQYRIAYGSTLPEAEGALAQAAYQDFNPSVLTNSIKVTKQFPNSEPNQTLFVAVQFKKGDREKAVWKSIKYLGGEPVISRVACNYLASGDGTRVTITGLRLGTQTASAVLRVNNRNLTQSDILTWEDETIVAKIDQKLQGLIPVKITTSNNQVLETNGCEVDTSRVEFTARLQCKTADFSASNVEIKIYENSSESDKAKPFYRQTISLDRGGKPTSSFSPRFEVNKEYVAIIKAPKSVARKFDFTASEGTTIIEKKVALPYGNIVDSDSDRTSKINAADSSELKRQWNIISSGSNKSADLVEDGRVNSLDYACLVSNYNQEDHEFIPPADGSQTPGASGGAGGGD